MEMTRDGTYIPKTAADNCLGCDVCTSICPVNNENIAELNEFVFGRQPENLLMGNFIGCYTGYSTDPIIRWKATSGGVITSLLIYLLRNRLIDGALLTRTGRDDPLKAEPFIARTEEDVLSAMGSKYVPVPLNELLNEVSSDNGRFAVVGLPCHIQGIRQAELKRKELRDRIVYHFGLVCSRTMSFRGVEYILRKMGVSRNDIAELKYRGEGWPSGIKVSLKSGDKKSLPMLGTWWSEIFGGYFFSHYHCTLCGDVLNEMSDISFADAYLPEVMKSDKLGTSILIARTSIGEELIKTTARNEVIKVCTLAPGDALKSQLFMSLFKKRNISARIRLLRMLRRPVPRSLDSRAETFLKPTVWDYIVSPIPYINIRISRGRWLSKIFERTPFGVIRRYRGWFKRLLMHNAEEAIEHLDEPNNSGGDRPKIVITNSHANNRGDEAAQRSLINSLRMLVPNANITVLTRSPNGLQLQGDVRILQTFFASKKTTPFIILWAIFRSLGLPLPTFHKRPLEVLQEMANADVVISAPGGPYFGDIYVSHEIQEHLLHVLLAKILRKPVMIYAPSMGPFKSRKRNIIRRYVLNKVEIITLRDHISKKYLETLKLTYPLIYLTADSAFQDIINIDRDKIKDIMDSEKIINCRDGRLNGKLLVGITPAGVDWNYRGSPKVEKEKEQERYNKTIAKAIDYLGDRFDATTVFFPQLYGKDDDLPLINEIIKLVEKKGSVRVLSKKWDSDIQQAIISQMDMVIGNRYHSVIFALKAEVPTVCLAYEHKSVGIMQAAELGEFVINIKDLTYENLIDKINQVWDQRERIKALLKSQMEIIRKRSFINSILAAALIKCANRHVSKHEELKIQIDKLMLGFQQGNLPMCNV